MPVILVNRVVDPKKNNRKKMEGRGEGEAQGVADPKKESPLRHAQKPGKTFRKK
jgi:hypothetical protein